jgi:hypothetical protein
LIQLNFLFMCFILSSLIVVLFYDNKETLFRDQRLGE